VDRVIELFYQRMDMFCESQEPTDMSVWLKRYTFDVVGVSILEFVHSRQSSSLPTRSCSTDARAASV